MKAILKKNETNNLFAENIDRTKFITVNKNVEYDCRVEDNTLFLIVDGIEYIEVIKYFDLID